MPWTLCILGTNAAAPITGRFPVSQVLITANESFLVDCGEGTQSRLHQYRVRTSRIRHIFISHLHGDHVLGLPGLINTWSLFGRKEKLTVYGPPGIRDLLEQIMRITEMRISYPLSTREHNSSTPVVLLDGHKIRITTLPLEHRIATTGYLFEEKPAKRRIDPEMVALHQVPFNCFKGLQQGQDWTNHSGKVISNSELTLPGRPPLRYAYCSDTRFLPSLAPLIRGVNLLYHEATFHEGLEEEALKRGHSTASQAARLAALAEVEQLIIGHFSARYKDPEVLGKEARSIFPATIVAKEGLMLQIGS